MDHMELTTNRFFTVGVSDPWNRHKWINLPRRSNSLGGMVGWMGEGSPYKKCVSYVRQKNVDIGYSFDMEHMLASTTIRIYL